MDTDLRGGENRVSGEAGGQEVAEGRGMTYLEVFPAREGLRSQHFVSLFPTLEGPRPEWGLPAGVLAELAPTRVGAVRHLWRGAGV